MATTGTSCPLLKGIRNVSAWEDRSQQGHTELSASGNPRTKLEAYVLDPTHPVGRNKAVVFKSALGFERSHWEMLRDSIIREIPYHEAVVGKTDQHGTRYNVTMPITGPNGLTVRVLMAWIIKSGADYPSFVTALVK